MIGVSDRHGRTWTQRPAVQTTGRRAAIAALMLGGGLGHTDPAFTLRVYAHAMRRSEEEREQLTALVEGHDWAHIGHKRPNGPPQRGHKTTQWISAATKRTRR